MNIHRDVFQEMLKGFAEMANEQGLKLDSDLKREGRFGGDRTPFGRYADFGVQEEMTTRLDFT